MNSASLLGILLLMLISVSVVNSQDPLINRGIYSFLNRHDDQILTAINLKTSNPLIVVDIWRDAATQKWRAISAYIGNSYQLKPTSDEERVMNVDPYSAGQLVSQSYSGFGFSSSQYWQVESAGQGYSKIKNYGSGLCLYSLAPGKQVGLAECNNSYRQQWKVTAL